MEYKIKVIACLITDVKLGIDRKQFICLCCQSHINLDFTDRNLISELGEYGDNELIPLPVRRSNALLEAGNEDDEVDQVLPGGGSGIGALKDYYGNLYFSNWPYPARQARSASFAHVLRIRR